LLTVAATELKNKLGQIIDQARRQPVLVQSHGRDVVVIVDHAEFARLQQLAALSEAAARADDEYKQRLAALAIIQSGKFARARAEDEPLASAAFALAKETEKALEESPRSP
jgi:prevent-host-death family protein